MTVRTPVESSKIDWKLVGETTDPEAVRGAIAREIQNWGGFLIALGVIHLLRGVAELDPVWGVVLIVTGAMSYYFRSAGMLAVYGVLLAWVAFTKMLSGDWVWMAFAAVQAFLAVHTFQLFVRVRRATSRVGIGLGAGAGDRAAGVFAWAGCGLALSAWAGLVALIGVAAWYTFNGQALSDQAAGTSVLAIADLAILGLALAVAALLARYRFRVVSILAIIGVALLFWAVITLVLVGLASA